MAGKNIFLIILISALFLAGCGKSYMVELPKDFKVIAAAGGIAPGTAVTQVEIYRDGKAVYSEMSAKNRSNGVFEEKGRFQLPEPALRDIYRTIKQNDFFNLSERHRNDNVLDGSFAMLTITLDGKTHTVMTQNIEVERFDKIMIAINLAIPGMNKIMYNAILK